MFRFGRCGIYGPRFANPADVMSEQTQVLAPPVNLRSGALHAWLRLILPLALVFLIPVLQRLYPPAFPSDLGLLPFLPAVIIAAWYGGLLSGAVASLAGWIIGDLFFLQPLMSLGFYGPPEIVQVLLYLCIVALSLGACQVLASLRAELHTAQTDHQALEVKLRDCQKAEEALRHSEHRFRMLTTNSPVGIFLSNPGGEYLFVNECWSELAGIPGETAEGDGWIAAVHPEDRPGVLSLWRAAVQNAARFESDYRFRTPDGKVSWLHVRAVPLKARTGEITGFLGSVMDVTARKEADLELADAQAKLRAYANELEQRVAERTARLQESLESLEAILYHVTHDLRAPLRGVQGFTELVLANEGDKVSPESLDLLQRSLRASKTMDRLITDILEFGRAGYQKLALSAVDLGGCLDQVLKGLEPVINSTGAQITLTKPLPVVMADSAMLERVWTNLLTNAMKFIAPDAKPAIEISSEILGDYVRTSIRDHGIGIAPDDLEKIFVPFGRIPDSQKYPGTGVGLSIVRKGVERMGGRMGVESELGKGSCFWVELPQAPARQPAG